jgi:alginate O-acetyltransferase complex protein AlgI
MLFNSYEFIIFFLPITIVIFFKFGEKSYYRIAISWLVSASLFFYAWWNPIYLGLIIVSILFNYSVGIGLGLGNLKSQSKRKSKLLLIFGVSVNLSLLGYFKYANFIIENVNYLNGTDYNVKKIILPLAISFFTFQQIAYLVDAYRGETKEHNFLHYCLFVTFFPQLIAGPIVHHKDILPQFGNDKIYKPSFEHFAAGITIFSIGLFKKLVLADGVSVYVTPVFQAAEIGVENLTFLNTWCAVLAYTLQLYFDFSGYSDMAIGIGRMFGIRLPLNFNSPYKALNIIDFWQRWHITLSKFLRDYLYISLGGNRKGKTRRYANLLITMLLGGLWHGAGWTFALWGIAHGVYLMINHAWRSLRGLIGYDLEKTTILGSFISRSITFIAVCFTWVFFRAETYLGALEILKGLSGINGLILPTTYHWYLNKIGGMGDVLLDHGVYFGDLGYYSGSKELVFISLLLCISWFAPNTQQLMIRCKPAFETYRGEIKAWTFHQVQWDKTILWAYITAFISVVSFVSLSRISEFLYFQF